MRTYTIINKEGYYRSSSYRRDKEFKERQSATRNRAIIHASKAPRKSDIPDWFRAPRGLKTEITDLAKQVWELRNQRVYWADWEAFSLNTRLKEHLLNIALKEIRRRGLSRPAGWPDSVGPTVVDRADGQWLIQGQGYHEYSRRFGTWKVGAAYLCGKDDGHRFAVRVPSTCLSVASAMDWLMPAAIKKALEQGLPVKRQGDIFFRPVKGLEEHDMSAIRYTEHEPRPRKDGGLNICHGQHHYLVLSGKYKWRAYRANTLSNGTGGD